MKQPFEEANKEMDLHLFEAKLGLALAAGTLANWDALFVEAEQLGLKGLMMYRFYHKSQYDHDQGRYTDI